ncbi:MAG TPA: NAD(P)-binding domain-containing protein [Vitreimonas sp.]|nr:NAD(P)-binding domain-containing protein [Vitreimonas sp.]
MNQTHFTAIVVGAGPGGLTAAAALKDRGIDDVLVIEKGEIGQAWLDYPAETHLLSESSEANDDNMIADLKMADVMPNVPHPSHLAYQKYLRTVVEQKKLQVLPHTCVVKVEWSEEQSQFTITTESGEVFTAQFLIWAAGMFTTPNESLEGEEYYVHYARIKDYTQITDSEVTVVGSANGASGVVMALAQPGRVVTMIATHEYTIPEPIDCLWKENMKFIKDLEKQGLVKIKENFRAAKIEKAEEGYRLISTTGESVTSTTKPIVCIGFLPTIETVKNYVGTHEDGHDWLLDLDEHHQSRRQSGLYFAGTLGKLIADEGFIRHFRNFGPVIADDILEKVKK